MKMLINDHKLLKDQEFLKTLNFFERIVLNSLKFSNLSSIQIEKLMAVFWIKLTLILNLCKRAKISLIFSSIMKEKSIEESEINNWFFFTIKQQAFGSKSAPLDTEVPGNKGFIKDFTKSGIFRKYEKK